MKKVLSFVLILALVLGSFSFAFGLTDIEDSANTEAITVANDLGIIKGFPDGSFKPDQTVNRAEFAAMITRALAIPESALAAYSATSFKDTSGYGWAVPYLAFCESKGIMIGDGYGNVMPGRTINVNEAITMAVRAIGYTENSSMLVGTWPSNYVTLGQALGLYDDVATATMVARESAAQMIYNALTVDMVTVNADGETKAVNGGGTSMLTAGLGAKVEKAAIIEGTEDSKINLQKYLGAYAVTYTKDGDVVAVGDVKSTFLTGEIKGSNEFKADGVTYTNLTSGAFSTTPTAQTFDNGVVSAAAVDADVATVGDTITVAVDLSGKKIVEIYSVLVWDTDDEFKFEDGDLDDETLGGHKFTLDDDDMIDYTSFSLIGVNSLSDIAEDNVIYVYESGNEITRVEVGTEVVKGQITSFVSADSEYVINGVAYATAGSITTLTVGDVVEAYLDVHGAIWEVDVTKGTTGNYAVLIASKAAIATGYGNGDARLFTKDGEEIDREFDKAAGLVTASGLATGTAVKYALNSSGKISDITTLAGTTLDAFGEFNKTSTIFKVGNKGYAMDSKVVVFVRDGNDYSLGAVTDINTEENVTLAAMSYDGTGSKIKVIIVDEKYTSGTDTVYAVLNSADARINADGDVVQYLKGLALGNTYEAWVEDGVSNITPNFTSTGGLIMLTVNNNGLVTDAKTTITSDAAMTGTVTAVDGKMIQVSGTSIITWITLTNDVGIYTYDVDDSEWVTKSINYLRDKMVKVIMTDADTAAYDIVML